MSENGLTYQELAALSIDELRREMCACIGCADCYATGSVHLGYEAEDREACMTCDGSGVSEECDRCQLLYEYEQDREALA